MDGHTDIAVAHREKSGELHPAPMQIFVGIAKIDDVMWNELFMCNRDELARQMDIFSENFERMRRALKEGDTTTMRRMMRTSTERRKLFDKPKN